ncbi:bifunctional transcriptional activator/DNA repair enzyme AdaA [Fundicoccus culcitae]|uniref:AraC family transcriptional regulator n=1 Tax=Fundicoccus culcitae TaxID=2969821 RepID=A0ABY5P388_9LACT|nr:Ada metal-binding domain-containing protein [Fundicoccus culcitae]UUX33029.1 AraC family transcriptional regulator [Fundicoccus culcitae]
MAVRPNEEQKRAIMENNKDYDGQFFYAVQTTRIFCRPSCKSRTPNFDHVTIYPTPEAALAAGYRPCKRCNSAGRRLPNDEWVLYIKEYIDDNYAKPLTLKQIADDCHGSPFHLHRVFTDVKGMTPLAYVHHVRLTHAKVYLKQTTLPIKEIAKKVGIANASRFSTLFKAYTKQTPKQYRNNHLREEQNNGYTI